jgi:hypothetical protein
MPVIVITGADDPSVRRFPLDEAARIERVAL